MSDFNKLNEESLYKNKEKYEIKTESLQKDSPENPYVLKEDTNPKYTEKKKPEDIFPREEFKEGMLDWLIVDSIPNTFAHEVRTMEEDKKLDKKAKEALRREQKKLVKDTYHSEKADFSLIDALDNNPLKVYEWLKASAYVDGASDSFKELIKAFGNLINSPEIDIEIAGTDLINAANSYLSSHSANPAHLYGKQRVLICNIIKEQTEYWTPVIAWQRTLTKEGMKDRLEEVNTKEVEISDNLEWKKTYDELEATLRIADEEQKAGEEKKAKEDKLAEEKALAEGKKIKKKRMYSNPPKINYVSAETTNKLEYIRRQRQPMLDEMVDNVLSLSEEEVTRFLIEPEYYMANYHRLSYLKKVATNYGGVNNPVDGEYFKRMDQGLKEVFDNKCLLILNLEKTIEGAIKHGSGEVTSKAESDDAGFSAYNEYKESKKLNFGMPKTMAKIEEMASESEETKKIAAKFVKEKILNISDVEIKKEAEKNYNHVHQFIDKYRKDGVLCLPPFEEAKKIFLTGSVEDKFSLMLLCDHIRELASDKVGEYDSVGLDASYDSLYSALEAQLMEVKTDPNAETDLLALSQSDAEKVGVMIAGFAKIAAEKVYVPMEAELRALEKTLGPNISPEEAEEARRNVVLKYRISLDTQILSSVEGFSGVRGYDTSAGHIAAMIRTKMKEMPIFNEVSIAEYRCFDKISSSGKGYKALSLENDKKIIKLGQENGTIGKNANAEYLEKNTPKEKRIEKELDYRGAQVYRILYSEKNKDTISNRQINTKIKHDKVFKANRERIALKLSQFNNMLYEYEGKVRGVKGTNRDDNYILYYLRLENMNKKTEDLDENEKKIRIWNEALARNYKDTVELYPVIRGPRNESQKMVKELWASNRANLLAKIRVLNSFDYEKFKTDLEKSKEKLNNDSLKDYEKKLIISDIKKNQQYFDIAEEIVKKYGINPSQEDVENEIKITKDTVDALKKVSDKVSKDEDSDELCNFASSAKMLRYYRDAVKKAKDDGLVSDADEVLLKLSENIDIYEALFEGDLEKDPIKKEQKEKKAGDLFDQSKKYNDAREKLYGQLFERMDEIMRFEISEEKLKDINWIVENYETLMVFNAFAGNLSNMEAGQVDSGVNSDVFLDRFHKLPHAEVLDKKLWVLSELMNTVTYLPGLFDVKFDQYEQDPTKLYIKQTSKELKEMEAKYKEAVERVLNTRYKEYKEARDKYLS